MRSRFSQLSLTALILAGATFAACTPNLDDKLSCLNSTQCPTGYFCGPDGKCQAGETVPEITVLTPTTGITFSGVIGLEMSVIDPAGITSVSVSLSGPMSDGGSPVAAAGGPNNIYTASLDTRAMGISSSGSFTATILATNAKGKSSTANVQLQLDDQPPLLGNVQISPETISAGQATLITFNSGESLTTLPVVTLTPPDRSSARYAAYVSVANNAYSYQFIPLPTDPLGAWIVQISAEDSEGNSSSTPGLDSFTVIAGGAPSATITGVRGDGATGPQAFYLKAGATLSLTAVFGTPLEAAPGAFLCPVGTAAPCQANTTGSASYIVSGSGTTYTFQIPAVVQALSPVPNEGLHVLSVVGSTQAGATLVASASVIFDFTAPSFTMQDIGDGSGNADAEGRKMVSFARDGSLLYAALINEPLTALGNISAVMDTGLSVAQVAHPTTLSQLPQFSVTLGPDLASAPPVPSTFPGHQLEATICDLAGNCATENSDPFVEVDQLPAVIDFDFPITSFDDSTLPDGGLPKAYRAGQTITVGIAVDRELENDNPSLVFEPFGDQSDFTYDIGENYTDAGSPAHAPFGYAYQTTISPNTSDGAYPVVLSLAYDGYGNDLIPSGSTTITSALMINVKTSVPVVLASDANANVISSEPNQIGAQPLSWYFVSQSGPIVLPVKDDLTTGSLAVCIDPVLSNGVANCTNSLTSTSPDGALTAIANVGVSGGNISNLVGRVDFTRTNATSGNHVVVISFTDEAGNVGVFESNLFVNGTGPVVASASVNYTQVPPQGTATLTFTVTDPSAISTVAGLNLSGFTNVAIQNPVTALGNGVYTITFTMPAQCNGAGGNPSGAAFPIGAQITDSVGLSYSTTVGAPLAMIACIPAPTVTSAQFDKTILYPGEVATATVSVDEALGNTGGTVTGSASVAGVTAVTSQEPNATTPRIAIVKYTMPAACLGASAPSDGVPFTVSVKLFDGIAHTTAAIQIGTLTCQNEPRITSYSWSNTVVASGTTATATLAVNEPLASAFGASSPVYTSTQLAISPNTGSINGFNPLTYTISVTPVCTTGGVPEDVPIAISATLGDGVHAAGSSSLGTITCIASSVSGATVNSAQVLLLKQPYPDGTVRSTVSGGPGVLTGMTGSKGISLVATDSSGNVLGQGPLSVDSAGVVSVAEFQIANGETQPVLAFTDLLGHSLSVPAGYPEELELNGNGLGVAGIAENPFLLYDVSTGDDAYYTPAVWLPNGPNPSQAARQFTAAAAQKLADIDDVLVLFGDAGVMNAYADAGGVAQALVGEEPFGNPLIISTDAGTQVSPGPRNYAAMAAGTSQIFAYPASNGVYLMGGSTTGDAPYDVWNWNQTTGWSAFAVNAALNGVYPQPYSGVILLDQYSTLYAIGGGTAPDAGFSNDIIQAVSSPGVGNGYEWQDAGNLGTPVGFGFSNPGPAFNIASSTSGYGALDAGGSPGYESMAVLANSLTDAGTSNCEMFITAGGYGLNTNSLFTCSAPTSNYGSRTQPAFALVPYPPPNVPAYTIYMFGGSGGQPNSVSNDLLGGATTYFQSTGPIINTNWTPMPVNSAKIPPARHGGSLYFIPDTNHLGLYGGVNASGTALTDAWEYDLTNGDWVETDLAPEIGPSGRAGAAHATDENGDLYQYGGIAGGSTQSDGWLFVRESRNRFIAKLPINSQLTNAAAATFSGLDITVAAPNTLRVGRSGPSEEAQPLLFLSTSFQIYVWTGSVWSYATSIGQYVNTITVPWSALSAGATDGNVYVMVTTFADDDSVPDSLDLDAVSFALHFK